jgi:ParB family chromosome partitioning protein
MAKNSTEAYQAEGKTNLLLVLPENLTIVGLDCPEEDCPELALALRPWDSSDPRDRGLTDSMIDHGFVGSAITIRKVKGDDRVFVTDGRRRVQAARAANAAIRKKDPRALPVRVRAMIDTSSDLKGSAGISVIANEHVRTATPLERARAADKLRAMGYTEDEIARTYAVTKTTLRGWSELLSAPPEVLDRVAAGELSASTAREVGRLPPAEQPAAVERVENAIKAEGKDGGKVRERVRASGGKRPDSEKEELPGPIWSHRDLCRMRDWLNPMQMSEDEGEADEVQTALYQFLRVATGEVAASKAAGLNGFCPDPKTGKGRLRRWVDETGPSEKKAAAGKGKAT